MYAGQNDRALFYFDQVRKYYSPKMIIETEGQEWRYQDLISFYTGLTYFRMGSKHLHRAIKEFSELLKWSPQNAEARWLLNLSFKKLGLYPQKVPAAFVIPPIAFSSEATGPLFKEAAEEIGVKLTSLAGGVVVDDFNGDGRPDLFFTSLSPDRSFAVYLNHDGHFQDVTLTSGLKDLPRSLDAFHGDYNNDGLIDIVLSQGAWDGAFGELPAVILKGQPGGKFINASIETKIKTTGPSQAMSWGDFNNDGLLDLVVAYESEDKRFYKTQLWQNNGDGTFRDVAQEAGLSETKGYFKGAVWGDFNNDGLLDLLLSNLHGPSVLLKNMGPDKSGHWRFVDVSRASGIFYTDHTFACWFFDFDNDGFEDIFLSTIHATLGDIMDDYLKKANSGAKLYLFHNNHNGTFTNVTKEKNLDHTILTMGANFGDINNDGYPDIYLGTGYPLFEMVMPNRLFLNDNGRAFKDITESSRTGDMDKGHGVAFADLRGNGHLDIIANQGGMFESDTAQKRIYLNPGNANNWIKLKLIGHRSNRAAIGARIKVKIHEEGKVRFIYRTVNTGGSFGSGPLEQHIGLGRSALADSIEIFWPRSGKKQILEHMKANQRYVIDEAL